jgi:RimJ/RimL family protein N-acetyltransferase
VLSNLPLPTTLRTRRLLLRPWTAADAPALYPILAANLAHLGQWIPAHVATPVPLPELAERLAGFADDFASGRAYRYALLTPDGSGVLGEVDLFPRAGTGRVPLSEADHVELGYWLDAASTGQGLATEAAGVLLAIAAKLSVMTHAEIRCEAANARSAAVPQRLGFHLAAMEGELQVWRLALQGPNAAGVSRDAATGDKR